MKHFEGTKFPSLHENGDFYSRDTHLWATPIFEDKEDLSPFFWFPIPPTTGPFRIDSCYTSMINGGSQQSWHFSAFTNDETHWTTPPSTCWMAILPKKTTSKTKCEAGFWCTVQLLFWAKLPLKSQTQSHLLFLSHSFCHQTFSIVLGVFLCWLLFFHFPFFFPKPQQQQQQPQLCWTAMFSVSWTYHSSPQPPFSGHLWRSTSPEPCWLFQWEMVVFLTNEMPEMEPTNVRFRCKFATKKAKKFRNKKIWLPNFSRVFPAAKNPPAGCLMAIWSLLCDL